MGTLRYAVAVLGGGGREHALAWKLLSSPYCGELHMMGGNGGTASLGQQVGMALDDFSSIANYCKTARIDCLVVGPEAPLVEGLVDVLSSTKGLEALQVIGPCARAARLEGSKAFAKRFMARAKIPTPKACVFGRGQLKEAWAYVNKHALPLVLKADGLAAGKGVVICKTRQEAIHWLRQMLEQDAFGKAADEVLVETYLEGMELSCFALCNGTDYVLLPEAKDYKRAHDNNTGPNTGGMGAVSPVPFMSPSLRHQVEQGILVPTLEGLAEAGTPYCGFLFLGLMVVKGRAQVLEYNVRLGDPEAQSILTRLRSDLLELFIAMKKGCKLSDSKLKVDKAYAVALTLAAAGYPGKYEQHLPIRIDQEDSTRAHIFHAGTYRDAGGCLRSKGGRVLSVVGCGADLRLARSAAYKAAERAAFEGCFYRSDIGLDLI